MYLRHINKKIQDLAMELGIKLSGRRADGWLWDGETIATNELGGACSKRLLLHEMAHWVIADPERKKFPNFGLNYGDREEEEKACSLEIQWMGELGFDKLN